jgi:parallel beta-helix repeat protein
MNIFFYFPRLLGTVLLLFCSGIMRAEPVTLYVSPDGDDTRTGHSANVLAGDGPVRTLSGVQKEIREMKAKGSIPKEGLIVEIAPGRYYMDKALSLDDEDSGTSDGPIIYRSQEMGKTIFTGDVELTKSGPVTNPAIVDLLRAEARGQVRQIDLSSYFPVVPGFACGYFYTDKTQDHPIGVFQNDHRLQNAQWPQEGWAKTGECLGAPVGTGLDKHYPDGKFRFESDRLIPWAKEPDLWLYGMWAIEWADQRMKVSSIDLKEQTIQLADPQKYEWGFKSNQEFVAFNAISEIDRPGEWAVDRAAKLLYIWPEVEPSQAPVSLSVSPVLIQAQGLSHVRFEGMIFEGTRDTALQFDQCKDITLQGCTIRHIEGGGVKIADGRQCSVIGSDLYDLGEGGISLGGGDRITLTPSDNLVENCHIYDFGHIVAMYRPAVDIPFNSVGAKVRHNLIHDCPHDAIIFDGNDHLIEYNIIHNVCQHASDIGAIYGCARDWSKRGTIIRYNLIHDLRPADNIKDARRGIYLDDYTSGTQIYGNIITMGSAGMQLGGGKDNTITNNLILLCPIAVEYSSRGMDSFGAKDASQGRQSIIFQATLTMPYNTPLWRQRYPKIGPELEGDPVKAHDAAGNVITNNIIGCGGDVQIDNAKEVMKTSEVDHNAIIDGDPGLMDPATLDFRLKPDGAGMQALPSFKPLPVADMGLYPDPKRASPAVRFGPHVTPLSPLVSRLNASRTWQQAPVTAVAKGKVTVDGSESPGEWDTSLSKALVCSAPMADKASSLPAAAWAASDGKALFLLVVIDRDPSVPLIEKGKWGERDGFEIIMRNSHDPHVPAGHILCYPDGTFACVPVGWHEEQWSAKFQKQISYAAKIQSRRWTAEVRLPLDMLGIGANDKIFFNLNIRRMGDQSWMGWVEAPNGFAEGSENGVLNLTSTKDK